MNERELMTRKERKQKAKEDGKKFIPINGYEGSKDKGWDVADL